MRNFHLILVLLPYLAFSQIKKEAVPSVEDQMVVSTEIETASDFEAPKMQGSLHGMESSLPAVRTAESVFEEVRQNQSRLSHLYKMWKMKEVEGVGPRTYGLVLTIRSSGEVEKVVVKGHTNKEFLDEVQANVLTWNFSKVKEGKPYVANLKNLDFLYRRNLVLE